MTAVPRRNACPTIARPMETGDGLLARLPPAGPLQATAIRRLADAAGRYGNGTVEVTTRGSLQVRGLAAESVASFAAALAAAGIADARPAVLAVPLAGLDPGETGDLRAVAEAIRRDAAGRLAARLAPKTSVIVDGGGALHLDAVDADIRLAARDAGMVALAVGGTASTARRLGVVGADRAAEAALAVLHRLADMGPTARGRDLDMTGLADAIRATPERCALPRRAPAEPLGVHALRDGTVAVGIGLPFGQTDAATLAALVDAATAHGAAAFVPAPGRALLVLGLLPAGVADFASVADALGYIVEAGDPRRSVAACAGAPACAAGLMPARAVAASIAEATAAILDGSVALHVAGCAKGCAHPGTATLAFVGTGTGAGLVVDGKAGDPPSLSIDPAALADAATRLTAAIATARRPGETSADAIRRLGPAALAAALHREPANA